MGDSSTIEWTDATWNPVTGCSKVSPGCAHCYAQTVAARFWPQQYVHTVERGFISVKQYNGDRMDGKPRQFTDVMTHEDRLDQPLRWRRPRRVFVNSMSDLFHEDVPDEFIDRVFAVMALAPQHTFQILTKRAERMRDYLLTLTGSVERMDDLEYAAVEIGDSPCAAGALEDRAWPLPNVWLGVSVENQRFADERIPLLLQTPAAVRFISAEPLLGPINLTEPLSGYPEQTSERSYVSREMAIDAGDRTLEGAIYSDEEWQQTMPTLSWVIVGGESGPGARPLCLSWVRNIVHDCADAGVACFVKQLGAKPYETTADDGADGECRWPIGSTLKLKHAKGGDPDEWDPYLRVREFPEVTR